MKFTKELQDTIIAALEQKLGQKMTCPVCQHVEWILTKGFVLMPIHSDSTAAYDFVEGRAALLAVLTCNHCGNTLFFNLLSLGLSEFFKDQKITTEHDIKL